MKNILYLLPRYMEKRKKVKLFAKNSFYVYTKDMTIGIMIFVSIVCIGIGILLFFRTNQEKLSPEQKSYFLKQLKNIQKDPSFSAQIIDLDTLLHQILKEM